ncbi:phosphatase PAP2 family protein [Desulfothermus okinawensis JCM 13304]
MEITLSKYFFDPGRGWFLRNAQPWKFLYLYGPIPAIIMAGAGFLTFVSGFFIKKIKKYSRIGLYLFLVMVIGPGIIVNGILKGHWGRPRPRQTKTFNGKLPYRTFWQKGTSGMGRSFPSGHASVGFYLFTPYFVFRKKQKKWAYFFLTLGIGSGLLIGLARIIQGAHFITDIIYSGLIVYLTGLVTAMAMHVENEI